MEQLSKDLSSISLEQSGGSSIETSQAAAAAPKQAPIIFDLLPTELIDQITSLLDYHDATTFRETCRATSTWLPFASLRAKRQALKSRLMAAERAEYDMRHCAHSNAHQWITVFPGSSAHINNIHLHRTTRAGNLNCYACLRSLDRAAFNSTQTTATRSLGHKNFAKRFCIDCGWQKRIWERGSVRGKGAGAIVVCCRCGGLNRENPPVAYRAARVCSEKCLLLCLAAAARLDAEVRVQVWVQRLERRKDSLEKQTQTQKEWMGLWPWRAETTVGAGTATTNTITITSTRASRCQRCWAVSHTEKPINQVGANLCFDCEVADGLGDVTRLLKDKL